MTDKTKLTPAEAGRLGGLKKVPKGYAMLSPEERSKRSRAAINARWAKVRAAKEEAEQNENQQTD
jgi:hypothetical protein